MSKRTPSTHGDSLERHYSKAEASALAGISLRTLERLRKKTGRPHWTRIGLRRVSIPESEVQALIRGEIAALAAKGPR